MISECLSERGQFGRLLVCVSCGCRELDADRTVGHNGPSALSGFSFRVAGVERSEPPDVVAGGSLRSTPATQPGFLNPTEPQSVTHNSQCPAVELQLQPVDFPISILHGCRGVGCGFDISNAQREPEAAFGIQID